MSSTTESQIRFREVSKEWGLNFHHRNAASGTRYMVETTAGGVVVLDYDGDGDDDVLMVDGGTLPGYEGPAPATRLYRNDGPGQFVDVTAQSGLTLLSYGCGGTAADVDRDGDIDLYLTAFGADALFLNDGDGTFTEATESSGLGNDLWAGSAAFGDVDRDGDLDLYVTNYVDFSLDNNKFCGDEATGQSGYCSPRKYDGEPDLFFRNQGGGRFRDETADAGFAEATYAGFGLVFGRLDEDEWPDLYVANDTDANYFFLNREGERFEDQSLLSGTSHGVSGNPEAGMGVDLGDIDLDGLLDIVVTNFELETNVFYLNQGGALFTDGRHVSRLAEPTLMKLAFGVDLADLDNDGDLDLAVANGHILDNAELFNPASEYAQLNQIFENDGEGKFSWDTEAGLDVKLPSRGLASADFDHDGDIDLVIGNSNERVEVYENVTDRAEQNGTWLQLRFVAEKSPPDGIGARATANQADWSLVQEVRTGSSFLSQNGLTLHFGLRAERRLESLSVEWPSGRQQRFQRLPANRRVVVVEG